MLTVAGAKTGARIHPVDDLTLDFLPDTLREVDTVAISPAVTMAATVVQLHARTAYMRRAAFWVIVADVAPSAAIVTSDIG